jgi:hypothetical protein
MTTYVISAARGMLPTFSILDRDGISQTPVSRSRVPRKVLENAAWLSAMADGRPLPPGKGPPVVIAPTRPGEPYTALVEVDTP